MTDASNPRYHPRRMEKNMPSREDQLAVIRGQQFLSIAMCKDNEPYLVSLDYGFDEDAMCFYVHCANEGRKLDFLRANPRVWGQIIEDRGYIAGECSHSYRSVMFEGVVEWVEGAEAKLAALALMVDQFEPEPEEMKSRLVVPAKMPGTTVLRIRILNMSGKQSPPPGKG